MEEIKLIDATRTEKPIEVDMDPYKEKLIRHKRKKRDRASEGLIGITIASMVLNVFLAITVYFLQAGPF